MAGKSSTNEGFLAGILHQRIFGTFRVGPLLASELVDSLWDDDTPLPSGNLLHKYGNTAHLEVIWYRSQVGLVPCELAPIFFSGASTTNQSL